MLIHGSPPVYQLKKDERMEDNYNLISVVIGDKINTEILCSMYDKNICAKAISSLLDLDVDEITSRLKILFQFNIISKIQKDSDDYYFLTEPKICDSLLMLKDALNSLAYKYRVNDNQ